MGVVGGVLDGRGHLLDGGGAFFRAQLVLLAATLPELPLREAMTAALVDEDGRAFLGVHDAGGVQWLVKESFEALAQRLAEREAALGHASVAMTEREVEDVARVAAAQGYRAEAIAEVLARPKLEPPARVTTSS